ncbi:MAG TPA: hypoxanthine-guanine phosphoribosyltransferase [Steroidobacteraceae bacterium]|nr:hypoxanthine-guanine phosphoribosyltransferase [Steroidobacteraceae bacterium]
MTQDVPRSEEVVSEAAVQAALDRMAHEITSRLAGREPLVVTVMNGGLVFAGQLLPRLGFALDLSYVHVRRYGRETKGGELVWIAGPHESVTGRTVLLLDDILDEGQTLLAIRSRLYELGATEVLLAAFAVKIRPQRPKVMADFAGIRVPDRFVFGFGMDVGGRWRNLPSVRALADSAD